MFGKQVKGDNLSYSFTSANADCAAIFHNITDKFMNQRCLIQLKKNKQNAYEQFIFGKIYEKRDSSNNSEGVRSFCLNCLLS